MGRRRGGVVGVPELSKQAKELVGEFNTKKAKEAATRFSEGAEVLKGKLAGIVNEGERKAASVMPTSATPPPKDGYSGMFSGTGFDTAFRTTIRTPATNAGRRKTLRTKFDHCVKAVRKTVKARKGSNKESAAIAICTKTVLHPRGRTLKRYRKGRLLTQKKMRGGTQCY